MNKVSYKKLFKIMVDKDLNKTDLCRKANIGWNTMSKLSKGQVVSMDVLIKICKYLNCSFDDICEIVR